jgi:hypothetical protein
VRPALVVAVLGVAVAGTGRESRAGHGGVVIPPVRVDLGPSTSAVDDAPALQVVAGVQWASVYPRGRARIDAGFGVVSVSRADPEPPPGDPEHVAAIAGGDPLELLGGYAEVATRAAGTGWWRTWVGTRIESGRASLGGRSSGYVGVATRVSVEAFVAGSSSSAGALVLGVLAIGVYAEVAVRRIDGVGDDVAASAGASFRIPLIIGG